MSNTCFVLNGDLCIVVRCERHTHFPSLAASATGGKKGVISYPLLHVIPCKTESRFVSKNNIFPDFVYHLMMQRETIFRDCIQR